MPYSIPSTATPNHALQRTAPRVTARAFCERSGSYIRPSFVRSTVGHAPRHAPPSLSLGSLAVAMRSASQIVALFIAFLYSQPLRSYLSTRHALDSRAQEVRSLRAEKQRLEEKLAEADTPAALIRQARSLGYVKAGERLFIVKGIAAWRRLHESPAN